MLKCCCEKQLRTVRDLNPLVEGQGQETEQELLVVVAETPDRLRVLVHNDDVTPYDFVVLILQSVFLLAAADARRVTGEAHTSGVALVAVLPEQVAKYRVGQAHALARTAGVPLTFSLQSE